jgi:exodeoxyribonuclease VII small subunit
MEAGDLSLEDSLKFFEEGVKLSRECNTQLATAEQKVKVLLAVDQNGVAATEDFQIKE